MPPMPRVPPGLDNTLLPTRQTQSGPFERDKVAERHLVLCPMERQEVSLERCEQCSHGHDWIYDQVSNQVRLRCSYLARRG